MLTDLKSQAQELQSLLKLAAPPIGIAFRTDDAVHEAPRYHSSPPTPTADGRTGAVPAGCFFWFQAVDRVFSTVADDHANCSVGSYTHGFKTLQEAAAKSDTGALFEAGWVTEADVPGIAHVQQRPGSIVYGPLADMPMKPDSFSCGSMPSRQWCWTMHSAASASRANHSVTWWRSRKRKARSR